MKLLEFLIMTKIHLGTKNGTENNMDSISSFTHLKLYFARDRTAEKQLVMHNLFLRIQYSDKPFKTLIIIQPSTSKEHGILDPTYTMIY